MFGLMKYTGSCLAPAAKHERQTRYCGTCKSIGRLFGQSARATLNHDAVFLGELLSALQPTALSSAAFTPRRCFVLPKADDIPPALAYAAAANVVLTEFAVTDQLLDGDKRWWPVQKTLSRSFHAARAHLLAAGLPVETLFAQQQRQAEYERTPSRSLAFFAEPTGAATRLVFAHGAASYAEPLGLLGEAFGRLIYVLDAIQDQVQDTKKGAFNALTASQTTLTEARRYVREQQARFQEALEMLPLLSQDRESFALRLRASVNHALMSTQLPGAGQSVITRPVDKKRRRSQGPCSSCWETICCVDCACNCCADGACCCEMAACEGCCSGGECCACGSC